MCFWNELKCLWYRRIGVRGCAWGFLFVVLSVLAVFMLSFSIAKQISMLQVIDPSLYVAKLEDTQGIEEANVSK